MQLKLSKYVEKGIDKTIDDALFYHQMSRLNIETFKEKIKAYSILAALEANGEKLQKRLSNIDISIQKTKK